MIQIDILPDDVLLGIFDFYEDIYPSYEEVKATVEAWQSLIHVCRRWRILVFGSPRHLNLRLYCTPQTPVKDRLDIWPALPLIVQGNLEVKLRRGIDNVIAALGESNRVREVKIWSLLGSQSENDLAPMQVSFPELTYLHLHSDDETPRVIPDSFLGGSAPRLGHFSLSGISFLGLPKLLLSATQLTSLILTNIPHSGYISPEAIVAALSALSGLKKFYLEFRSPQSRPDRENQSLSPPNRSVLPSLYVFLFKGVTEYLEELTNCIDTPQLNHMDITFFNQIDFDCPRLAQFIDRTPKLRALNEAHVRFDYWTAVVRLRTPNISFSNLQIHILCREPDWQLSSMEQVCNNSLPAVPTVEDLYIERGYTELLWAHNAIENNLWLQLLLPFTAVKNLYLSKGFAPGIVAALYEARMTYVLPSLQNIFVERPETLGPFHEYIELLVAARQLRVSDHPINISVWGNSQ